MGWELKQDSKCKCWLNLDELGKTYRGYDWKNSVDKKIGIRYKYYNDEVEEKWFTVNDYIVKDRTKGGKRGGNTYLFLVDKDKKNFEITTYHLLNCKTIAKLFNKRTKDFKHNIGDEIGDIVIIDREYRKDANDCDVKYYKYQCKCRNIGWILESDLKRGTRCNLCSDGKSYPEKFTANVLTQLNIKFITELNRTTFDWCQNFRYDFYLPDDDRILETNGNQHYEDTTFTTHEEVHKNDSNKRNVAVLNVSDYIVIDCRHSTIEWMKENIIKELGHLYDLSNVDWEKADRESQKSHMILACKLKRENQKLTVKEIIELIKEETGIEYCNSTITNWLNRGTKLGLCYYYPTKKVYQKDLNGNIIKIWDSAQQISNELGYHKSVLSRHINGRDKGKPYKDYIWECVE